MPTVSEILASARTPTSEAGRLITGNEIDTAWAAARADGSVSAVEVDAFRRIDPTELTRSGRDQLRHALSSMPNLPAPAAPIPPSAPLTAVDRVARSAEVSRWQDARTALAQLNLELNGRTLTSAEADDVMLTLETAIDHAQQAQEWSALDIFLSVITLGIFALIKSGRHAEAERFAADAKALHPRIATLAPRPIVRTGFDALGKPVVADQSGLKPRTLLGAEKTHAFRRRLLREWDESDAATMWPFAHNAQLDIETFAYGTHKPRAATVVTPPANGMLDLTLFMTPSSHVPDGGTDAEKAAQRTEFAKTNTYGIRVEFPDGTTVDLPRNGTKIRNRPVGTEEYATAWDIAIPLMKGDTKISAWPSATSADGYIERRQTVIHWDGP